MVAVITLFVILTISILVTRIATSALTYTGISREMAKFQARSAFTGVGFTTRESERIVNHPVRRRIVLILMLLGNAGIITVVASLVLTFVNFDASKDSQIFKAAILIFGLLGLWGISSSEWVDRKLSVFIGWMLKKYTKLDVRDYANLLHMAGEYKVIELYIEKEDWLSDKMLQDLDLEGEGILILGITRRNGMYIGAPSGSSRILAGDTLVIYGRESIFEKLDQRRKGKRGDAEHERAVKEHQKAIEKKETVGELQ